VDDGEVLLLPEVFSVLSTEKVKRDFALEGNTKDEKELRESRWWGRLYIEGWPQTVQFMRAHFGQVPPEGVLKVVLAEPADACGGLLDDQGGDKYTGAIVFARRGNCTFSSKARVADKAKAAALVLVNNEAGNDHLSGPDAHDVGLSVSMVAQQDGELVLRVLEHASARAKAAAAAAAVKATTTGGGAANKGAGLGGGGVHLTAAMVPIHCTEHSTVLDQRQLGNDLCAPSTASEREFLKQPLEGGWISLLGDGGGAGKKFEFMIATFGTSVPAGADNALEVVVAGDPWDTCALLEGGGGLTYEAFNEQDAAARNTSTNGGVQPADDVMGAMEPQAFLNKEGSSKYAGKAVLIKRGGCPFIEKAKSAQAAGASAVLVANTHTGVSRFGVEPRWKGLGITIPVVMVTDLAGEALLKDAQSGGGAKVAFSLSKSVTARAWNEVDALREGDVQAWGVPKVPKKNKKGAEASDGKAAAREAAVAEALTQTLKQRQASGVDAGWPEREAAVHQGFSKLCPSAVAAGSAVCSVGAASDEL
jgi:hypothetical protein